jgi:hypothetical protein
MKISVRLNSDLSETFPIISGVKQSCALAPILFSSFFITMLKHATEDLDDDDDIYISYRLDGSLFNLRRLQTHIKTLEQLIHDLLFAETTLSSLPKLKKSLAAPNVLLCKGCSALRTRGLLKENRNPPPACIPGRVPFPHITVGETELKTVHQFTYLECTITSDAKSDKEVDNRLAKATALLIDSTRESGATSI